MTPTLCLNAASKLKKYHKDRADKLEKHAEKCVIKLNIDRISPYSYNFCMFKEKKCSVYVPIAKGRKELKVDNLYGLASIELNKYNVDDKSHLVPLHLSFESYYIKNQNINLIFNFNKETSILDHVVVLERDRSNIIYKSKSDKETPIILFNNRKDAFNLLKEIKFAIQDGILYKKNGELKYPNFDINIALNQLTVNSFYTSNK